MLSAVLTVCICVLVHGGQLERDVQTKKKDGSPLILYFVKRMDNLYDQVKDPVVYFRAYRSSRKSFGAGSTVLFDKEEANTGGGYNPKSAVFTAPVSGLYEFKCEMQTVDPGLVTYAISSQGKEQAYLRFNGPWTDSHMSAIFHVTAGHHVWIIGHWDDGKKPRIREGAFSQFSGFLLSKD